jgi:CheY-like chemotaxis protein
MPKYRVLIVDDQSEVRRLLRAGLVTLGPDIQVVDVPSGEEAILVISRQPFDLLIADVRLPGISGLELKTRARMHNPNLKLILITG